MGVTKVYNHLMIVILKRSRKVAPRLNLKKDLSIVILCGGIVEGSMGNLLNCWKCDFGFKVAFCLHFQQFYRFYLLQKQTFTKPSR